MLIAIDQLAPASPFTEFSFRFSLFSLPLVPVVKVDSEGIQQTDSSLDSLKPFKAYLLLPP